MTGPNNRVPNFFLAGVPKAGTTSLYFYLAQHPQVYMSPLKEPTFFGSTDILSGEHRERVLEYTRRNPFNLEAYLERPDPPGLNYWVFDWDDYLKLFRGARNAKAIGEASVSYFWMPNAASSIRAKIPDARFIFVLRDPAERLFALFARHKGLLGDVHSTFQGFFQAALDPRDPGAAHVGVGRYATHLQRFFDAFPKERIRIYLYEDYCADSSAVLRDVFTFLEVDPEQPIDISRRHNQTLVPRLPWLHAARRRLGMDRSATRWLPAGARRWLRTLYRRPLSKSVMSPEDRTMVIDYYRAEIARTADLIDRDLSAWLR
jgi:hypothetical protein